MRAIFYIFPAFDIPVFRLERRRYFGWFEVQTFYRGWIFACKFLLTRKKWLYNKLPFL